MEEKRIVRLFLQNGFQLSKSALSIIPPNPEAILSELKKIKPRPFIVTDKYIKKILKSSVFRSVEVKTIKKFSFNKKTLHVNDCVKQLLSRYEKIKSILIKQMKPKKLVSINKITSRTMKFSIIGLVKEKNDNSVLVEDSTGETNLYFDKNTKGELDNILPDDVLGVQCEKIKENYYIKKLIYPDVLSSRNITKTKEEILIAFVVSTQNLTDAQTKKLINCLLETKNLSSVFVFGIFDSSCLITPSELNLIYVPSNPVPILFGLDMIKILIIPSSFLNNYLKSFSTPEVFTLMLKRRELIIDSSQTFNIYRDFVLDEVPDIIASDFGQPLYLNYKGTTIISNSDPQKVFIVNLKTRDVQQILL